MNARVTINKTITLLFIVFIIKFQTRTSPPSCQAEKADVPEPRNIFHQVTRTRRILLYAPSTTISPVDKSVKDSAAYFYQFIDDSLSTKNKFKCQLYKISGATCPLVPGPPRLAWLAGELAMAGGSDTITPEE